MKKPLYTPKHLSKLSIMIEKKITKEKARQKSILGKVKKFIH